MYKPANISLYIPIFPNISLYIPLALISMCWGRGIYATSFLPSHHALLQMRTLSRRPRNGQRSDTKGRGAAESLDPRRQCANKYSRRLTHNRVASSQFGIAAWARIKYLCICISCLFPYILYSLYWIHKNI